MRDARRLTGRIGMVRRQLSSRLGLGEAASAGGEHERARLDRRGAFLRLERGCPAGLRRGDRAQSVMRQLGATARLVRLAERLRDRVASAIADLEEPVTSRAAAACEPVPAVRAGELDPELLEPVDRGRRLARQHLDERRVGRVVRRAHDVLGMDRRRVVRAERGLDASLRLGRVAGLQRRLGGEPHPCAGELRRDRGSETGGAAADHEHVEGGAVAHERHSSVDPYFCH